MSELPVGVCLELPLKVNNISNAIKAVGGSQEIQRVTSESQFKEREGLELNLRNDKFHHPITSMNVEVCNIIVEIDLPKQCQTGNNVKRMLEHAKRLGLKYKVKPILHVQSLHRFRGMADFQYYVGDSEFAKKVSNSVLNGNLNQIQTLTFSSKSKADLLPPPRFSVSTQPFYYNYKQSAYLKVVDDESGVRVVNTAKTPKIISNLVSWGGEVPSGPPEQLQDSGSERLVVRQCLEELKRLFAERPSYTRRTLQYLVGPDHSRYLKFALPYLCYYYRSGPWRGAYIRYGVDVTKDRSMARYQVEYFRIMGTDASESEGSGAGSGGYLFDGSSYPDVPMLQLSDVADGVVEEYITTKDLREEVDDNDGWYNERTITIIRKVLRQELISLREEKRALTIDDKRKILGGVLDNV